MMRVRCIRSSSRGRRPAGPLGDRKRSPPAAGLWRKTPCKASICFGRHWAQAEVQEAAATGPGRRQEGSDVARLGQAMTVFLLGLAAPATAVAQQAPPARESHVTVYGDDPCPQSTDGRSWSAHAGRTMSATGSRSRCAAASGAPKPPGRRTRPSSTRFSAMPAGRLFGRRQLRAGGCTRQMIRQWRAGGATARARRASGATQGRSGAQALLDAVDELAGLVEVHRAAEQIALDLVAAEVAHRVNSSAVSTPSAVTVIRKLLASWTIDWMIATVSLLSRASRTKLPSIFSLWNTALFR